MLRNLLTTMRMRLAATRKPEGEYSDESDLIRVDIARLFSFSRQGLWGLVVFLAASAVALSFREYTLSSSIPPALMEKLGPTPPEILVNVVFGASTLSSLIIIAGKIYHNQRPGNTWPHLWFRVFFYVLYFIAGALNDYFNCIFISGLVVLGLQHCNIWNYYSRAIGMKMEKMDPLQPFGKEVSRK